MFDVEAVKARVTGDIRKLNARLLEVAKQLEKEMAAHEVCKTPPGLIAHAFYRKCVRSFEAIEIIKKCRLYEEAWILLRVLLETHVNLLYFLRHDPVEMSRRLNDAAVLDKLKHLREVNFYEGTPMKSEIRHKEFEKADKEIAGRYDKATLESLKKHGFSGVSFEKRSKAVGLKSMYEYCYRIASRSIHSFDPGETNMLAAYVEKGYKAELLKSRRLTLESVANMLLGRVSYIIATMVKSPLSLELFLRGVGYEKFRDAKGSVLEVKIEESSKLNVDGGDEEVYIWRE